MLNDCYFAVCRSANGTELKSCSGRVFMFKLGCFVDGHALLLGNCQNIKFPSIFFLRNFHFLFFSGLPPIVFNYNHAKCAIAWFWEVGLPQLTIRSIRECHNNDTNRSLVSTSQCKQMVPHNIRDLYHKTYYSCHLRISIISSSVCPWQTFFSIV
jgi:hypothetical protein